MTASLLQHGVTAQAEAAPDATALVFNGRRSSYRRLEEDSNRLARRLVELGTRDGDRVAIVMPKMPEAVVAMLGALKAGAAYVPLDPADPVERLARILATVECRAVLAAGNAARRLKDALRLAQLAEPPRIGWLDDRPPPAESLAVDFTPRDLAGAAVEAPPQRGDGDRIAHILFTSGSTGEPKGVMVRHRNVLHFLGWAASYFGLSRHDRVSQHPPLRFDVSTFDVFGTLHAGAELHLVPRELNLLPHRLAGFIRDARLTQWFSVPSVMNLMARFDVIRENDFPELKRVLFAGEVLPVPTLRYWMRRLPRATFTNLYGPTETTISSSYHTVTSCPPTDAAPVPIGRACRGEELLVLDDDLEPVAEPGTVGDLYIRGEGVTAGYWRDPDKTRQAFVESGGETLYRTGDLAWFDADGLVHYVGRRDAQVKVRGYRIELGEIEAALHALPDLAESVVVAIESDGFEGATLCCAYVGSEGGGPAPAELRTRLAGKLPAYMIPVRFAARERLPRNANGKYDRKRIAEEFAAGAFESAAEGPQRAASPG